MLVACGASQVGRGAVLPSACALAETDRRLLTIPAVPSASALLLLTE
jgi:hypothetical protein